MAVANGLDQASKMEPGSGRLEVGVAASLSKAMLQVDYAQRLARTRSFELSAFAQAQAGFVRGTGGWRSDVSAIAGARMTW